MSVPLATVAAAELATGAAAGPDLGRYILVCAVMVAAVAGLGFGFKRLVAGSLRARAAKRSLQVVDLLPLGGKQRLAVVRCYDRTFVLGLGDHEVGLIAELEREAAAEPAQDAAKPARARIDFRSLIAGLSGRAGRDAAAPAAPIASGGAARKARATVPAEGLLA